jgi:hypothetical protein
MHPLFVCQPQPDRVHRVSERRRADTTHRMSLDTLRPDLPSRTGTAGQRRSDETDEAGSGCGSAYRTASWILSCWCDSEWSGRRRVERWDQVRVDIDKKYQGGSRRVVGSFGGCIYGVLDTTSLHPSTSPSTLPTCGVSCSEISGPAQSRRRPMSVFTACRRRLHSLHIRR